MNFKLAEEYLYAGLAKITVALYFEKIANAIGNQWHSNKIVVIVVIKVPPLINMDIITWLLSLLVKLALVSKPRQIESK